MRWIRALRETPLRHAVPCVLAVGALAGCGGSSEPGDAMPPELAGTYTATIEQSDLPANASPVLIPGTWRLAIGELQGPDAGWFLSLKDPENATLAEPGLDVEGDVLTLTNEECAQDTGYASSNNRYGWTLEGSTLTLTTVENACADRVAEMVLTSRPWTKQ